MFSAPSRDQMVSAYLPAVAYKINVIDSVTYLHLTLRLLASVLSATEHRDFRRVCGEFQILGEFTR